MDGAVLILVVVLVVLPLAIRALRFAVRLVLSMMSGTTMLVAASAIGGLDPGVAVRRIIQSFLG